MLRQTSKTMSGPASLMDGLGSLGSVVGRHATEHEQEECCGVSENGTQDFKLKRDAFLSPIQFISNVGSIQILAEKKTAFL